MLSVPVIVKFGPWFTVITTVFGMELQSAGEVAIAVYWVEADGATVISFPISEPGCQVIVEPSIVELPVSVTESPAQMVSAEDTVRIGFGGNDTTMLSV